LNTNKYITKIKN